MKMDTILANIHFQTVLLFKLIFYHGQIPLLDVKVFINRSLVWSVLLMSYHIFVRFDFKLEGCCGSFLPMLGKRTQFSVLVVYQMPWLLLLAADIRVDTLFVLLFNPFFCANQSKNPFGLLYVGVPLEQVSQLEFLAKRLLLLYLDCAEASGCRGGYPLAAAPPLGSQRYFQYPLPRVKDSLRRTLLGFTPLLLLLTSLKSSLSLRISAAATPLIPLEPLPFVEFTLR